MLNLIAKIVYNTISAEVVNKTSRTQRTIAKEAISKITKR